MRKLRIFDYTWHIPHQYDQINALQADCEFTHCLNIKRQWSTSVRPKPENLDFVTSYQPGTYDVAILHIDQQIIVPGHNKKLIFEQFDNLIVDIPKIILNHGTPVFPERFQEMRMQHLSGDEMQSLCVKMVSEVVGDRLMVVNSYQSSQASEWGFGYPIVHGMNAGEWYDLPKEPRVFTALAPYGFDTYYNRECMFEVSDILFNVYGYTLAYARVNIDTSGSFETYREYLGKSLIYLDTSFRTPMNRARTEAFLSGCCVVQVEGAHDLERWAVDGENIIIVPNEPQIIARKLADLLEYHYEEAVRIGQRGKEMAKKEFSPDRYRNDWLNLLDNVIGDC